MEDKVLKEQGGQGEKPPKKVQDYVSNAMQLIHSEKTRDNIMTMLEQEGNPSSNIAQATVSIFEMIDKKTGGQIPNEIKALSMGPVMTQIMEVGVAANLFEMEEGLIKESAAKSVTLYMKNGLKSGVITKDEIYKAYKEIDAEVEKETGSPIMPGGPKSTKAPASTQASILSEDQNV